MKDDIVRPSAPSIEDMINVSDLNSSIHDIENPIQDTYKIPILVKLSFVFGSDWHPDIENGCISEFYFYNHTTWREIKQVYTNSINLNYSSIFLSSNGMAFDADKNLSDYDINSDVYIEAYLVPGTIFYDQV